MAEPFRHRLRVRWSECDLQGVVFYPNYLEYFDHLLTELWREAVGPYGDITQLGIDLVVAEARSATAFPPGSMTRSTSSPPSAGSARRP
jgi:acyl-CoA thioester hydrolase